MCKGQNRCKPIQNIGSNEQQAGELLCQENGSHSLLLESVAPPVRTPQKCQATWVLYQIICPILSILFSPAEGARTFLTEWHLSAGLFGSVLNHYPKNRFVWVCNPDWYQWKSLESFDSSLFFLFGLILAWPSCLPHLISNTCPMLSDPRFHTVTLAFIHLSHSRLCAPPFIAVKVIFLAGCSVHTKDKAFFPSPRCVWRTVPAELYSMTLSGEYLTDRPRLFASFPVVWIRLASGPCIPFGVAYPCSPWLSQCS